MRYWFDTEFIEDGKTIDLISIGIVAENGSEYYAINYDCDFSKASEWVKNNVIAQLPPAPLPQLHATVSGWHSSQAYKDGWRNRLAIAHEIIEFIKLEEYGGIELSYNGWKDAPMDSKPEFWAYYADYDWVVFCQLFGTMMDLPAGFPMYCRDIKQECDRLGNPALPEQGKGEHNALANARWNKLAWEFLRDYEINTPHNSQR